VPGTVTERIISDHLVGESDEQVGLRVDQVLLEDATGTMACLQFERLGLERIRVPTVSYVDHNVLQFDDKNPQDHAYLRSWAARYGALYSRPGNGISHYVHLERFARPGGVLVGADSHTTMAGALGVLAVGGGCDGGGARDGGPSLRRRAAAPDRRRAARPAPAVGAVEGRRARAAPAAGRARRPRLHFRVLW
jgi:homoaconitase/3-isopropylmalate dehydratase large subunit